MNKTASPLLPKHEWITESTTPLTKEIQVEFTPVNLGDAHAENNHTRFWRKWSRTPKETKGWKPVTLRTPILFSFMVFSVSMIILLEVLSQLSQRPENGGGIAFASSINDLSALDVFVFTYLPTILAVSYSMVWSWVDLDVKRLEPWYQLSREDGATAKDSLLLQYPFDFLPFVPVTAFRRRHWGVFFAGVVMLMIFWVVTPLQSAIFTTGNVSRNVSVSFTTSAKLTDMAMQANALDVNFMETAYGICWLNQTLPPFTTSSVVLLPFAPLGKNSALDSSEVWTTTATTFRTNLDCYPADVHHEKTTSYTFSNGKGCVVPDLALTSTNEQAPYMVSYIGYFDNPQNDWSLQNPNCSAQFSNTFLALWGSESSRTGPGIYSNLVALFCETTYTSEEMNVYVNATSHEINKISSTGRSKAQPNLSEIFNITNFEYLMGSGVPPITQKGNYPERVILQQQSQLRNFNITWPNTNMVGFAVALSDTPVQGWSQASVLQSVFEKAHQVLFLSAFSTLTGGFNETINLRPGVRITAPAAVILVRPISILVEIGLGLIILFTLSLWYYYYQRQLNLCSDPASIGDVMSMIHPDGKMADEMHDNGTLTASALESSLSREKYLLCKTETGVTHIRPKYEKWKPTRKASECSSFETNNAQLSFSPVRPTESHYAFGVVFIGLLLAAATAITFLYLWTLSHDGFSLPTTNAVVLSILTNYVPTAFATLVEPTWNMLNRLLCLLQPFDELRKGNAAATRSLDTTYTTVPPQLAFWKALRARHFLLAAVCITAVSTNVLAVTLSALLNQGSTTVEIPFNSSYQLSAQFSGDLLIPSQIGNGLFNDHFYVAVSNISHGNSLPPWIDQKFFYLPFELKTPDTDPNSQSSLQYFRGNTTGFGAQVVCAEVTKSGAREKLQFDVQPDGSSVQFSTIHIFDSGKRITCTPDASSTSKTRVDTNPFPDGSSAMEINQLMGTTGGDDGFCSSAMTLGWVRASIGKSHSSSNGTVTIDRNVTQTFLSCTQKLLVANFDVTVDQTGRVVASNRTSDFAKDITPFFVQKNFRNASEFVTVISNETTLFRQVTAVISPSTAGDFSWHNDSFNADWVNALLGAIMKSTSLVDPAFPAPNAATIAPIVEDLYVKLFSILLGINTHVFSPSSTPVIVRAIVTESRIYVSPLMFQISIVVLSLQILVAILYYTNRPKSFLPRMPSSVASIIAFVAASRAIEDFRDTGSARDGEKRYGYGRFVGTDGRTKVGIEKQRFVVPLEVENPYVKRRKWWSRIGKGDKGEVKSWI